MLVSPGAAAPGVFFMRQLFLAAELLDLVIAESEQDFYVLEIFRKLVSGGLISRDAVIIVTSSVADGSCEKIEVSDLRWDRLRRHDFVSYVDNLHRHSMGDPVLNQDGHLEIGGKNAR